MFTLLWLLQWCVSFLGGLQFVNIECPYISEKKVYCLPFRVSSEIFLNWMFRVITVISPQCLPVQTDQKKLVP